MKKLFLIALACASSLFAQLGMFTKEQRIELTREWKGERFADGRPKVPDEVLNRLKHTTAEEAWGHLAGNKDSVHLELFPEPQETLRDPVVRQQIDELLKLRGMIGQAIEKARQEKLIGNALEAAVVLRGDEKLVGSIPREELEEFFILSDLALEPATEASASITKTPNKKCARCWRRRPMVGKIEKHPDLCDRCAAVVDQRAQVLKATTE